MWGDAASLGLTNPLSIPPPSKSSSSSGLFGSILSDISSFVNSVVPTIYQAKSTSTAGLSNYGYTPYGSTASGASGLDWRSLALIGGVGIFGVSLVLMVRKKGK